MKKKQTWKDEKKVWLAFFGTIIAIFILAVAGAVYTRQQGQYSTKFQEQNFILKEENPVLTVESQEIKLVLEELKHIEPNTQETVAIEKKEPIDPNVWNILLIGQDARPGESRARSDTMMLLTYYKKENKAALTSFLRDTWVPIDGYGWGKLNAAFAFGGAGLAVNTINNLYHLDIQNYVVVDFDGFITLVDALGGIKVPITEEEAQYYNQNFPQNGVVLAGENSLLSGVQAFFHANNRTVGKSDFERTRRQRNVMEAMFDQFYEIKEIKTLFSLFQIALKNVETNLPLDQTVSLTLPILNQKKMTISQYQVPFDGFFGDETKEGQSVLVCDFQQNTEILKQFLYQSEE